MADRLTFEDFKDEDVLVRFLQTVWKAGVLTGKLRTEESQHDIVDRYMPKFKEVLGR